ncbi:MAG: hypothetical protein D6713_02130 [Deltaproteobacteria bacterium]|nr:MAG: hypothetical protein D6713_02130 [Deltaproteobacteria bacterium]
MTERLLFIDRERALLFSLTRKGRKTPTPGEAHLETPDRFLETFPEKEGEKISTLIIADIDLYLRRLEIPFDDVKKARLAAQSLITGTLPFEGEFCYDLLPLSGEGKENFLALIVRKEELESRVGKILASGETPPQVIPAALLSLALSGKKGGNGETTPVTYRDRSVQMKATLEGKSISSCRILPPDEREEEEEEENSFLVDLSESSPSDIGDLASKLLSHPELSRFNLLSLQAADVVEKEEKKRSILFLGGAILLIILTLISFLEGTRSSYQYRSKLLKGEVDRIFREIAGNVPVVDPVAQAEEKIRLWEEESHLFPREDEKLSYLLEKLASSITPSDGITVTSVKYVRGRTTIQTIAEDEKKVQTVLEKLRQSGLDGKIVDSGPAAEKGKRKITIQVEAG